MLRDNCVSFEGKDLVIDMKGLSYIPSCLDEEPVRSQRALLFQKGSTLHVPGVAGSYVTTKPWQLLVAPLMVKYTEASGIEDELVLSFTDCGLASSTMAGAGIVTLDFPLKVRHNVWKGENEAQMKALHNVVAFYPIDTKKIQYIDVGPCLKHYPPLCKLSIHVPATSQQMHSLGSQDLWQRRCPFSSIVLRLQQILIRNRLLPLMREVLNSSSRR